MYRGVDPGILERGGGAQPPAMRTPKARSLKRRGGGLALPHTKMKTRVPNKRFPANWDQNPRSYRQMKKNLYWKICKSAEIRWGGGGLIRL